MKPKSEYEIANQYNKLVEIWQKKDKWHFITRRKIDRFIYKETRHLDFTQRKILNAGSAGNNYCLPPEITIHIDLAEEKIAKCKNKIIGTIENIPLVASSIDFILCVGSVINYCDPVKAITEFTRVLKPEGMLLLEFENSYTLELLGKPEFNKKAVLINTFYNMQSERLWYFSETFIKEILKSSMFKIQRLSRWHRLSPLIYRATRNENFASFFSLTDTIMSILPGINKFSSNVILVARKLVN